LNFGTTLDESSFTIDNIGGGNLEWSIVQNFPAWLNIAAVGPNMPQKISVFVDRTVLVNRVGLPPDDYSHNISVLSNGGNGTVRVNMTIPPPTLGVSPTRIDFVEEENVRTLTIRNDGGGTLSWNATTDPSGEWLYFRAIGGEVWVPTWEGTIGPYGSYTLNVMIHRDLDPDDYVGFINVNSNGNPIKSARVRVTMTVQEEVIPQ